MSLIFVLPIVWNSKFNRRSIYYFGKFLVVERVHYSCILTNQKNLTYQNVFRWRVPAASPHLFPLSVTSWYSSSPPSTPLTTTGCDWISPFLRLAGCERAKSLRRFWAVEGPLVSSPMCCFIMSCWCLCWQERLKSYKCVGVYSGLHVACGMWVCSVCKRVVSSHQQQNILPKRIIKLIVCVVQCRVGVSSMGERDISSVLLYVSPRS